MKRIFAYIIIAILFVLITFFGLGPVMLADGSTVERIMTLAVVLALYAILSALLYVMKKYKN